MATILDARENGRVRFQHTGMSAVIDNRPRSGRYAPYKHPNVRFMDVSELGARQKLDQSLAHVEIRDRLPRASLGSSRAVHAAPARPGFGNGTLAVCSSANTANAASDTISDLDINVRESTLAPVVNSTKPETAWTIAQPRRISSTSAPLHTKSVFDGTSDAPESDPDSICPLARKPRTVRARPRHTLDQIATDIAHSNLEGTLGKPRPGGSEVSRAGIERAPRQRRLEVSKLPRADLVVRHQELEWQMRETRWSTVNAAEKKSPEEGLICPQKSNSAEGEASGFFRRLSTQLGIEKLRKTRAWSDPLPRIPKIFSRSKSIKSSVSIPAKLDQQRLRATTEQLDTPRKHSLLPEFVRKRRSQ